MKLCGLSVLVIAIPLWGCAMPGREALLENSYREELAVTGEYKAIAFCTAGVLDAEKWAIGDVAARVTRTLQKEGVIELQAGSPTSVQVLLWVGEFRPTAPNETTVAITARFADNPFLSKGYFMDKVKAAVLSCDGGKSR